MHDLGAEADVNIHVLAAVLACRSRNALIDCGKSAKITCLSVMHQAGANGEGSSMKLVKKIF